MRTFVIGLWMLGCGTANETAELDAAMQGRPQEVLASGRDNPGPIALAESTVYFIALNLRTQDANGSILAMPLDGGTVTSLATRQRSLETLAVDATHVYWTTGTPCRGCIDGEVKRVSRDGGRIEVLASAQNFPSSVLVVDGSVYWTNGGMASGSGSLHRMQPGQPIETLLNDDHTPTALATDGTNLYWASCGSEADFANGNVQYNADGLIRFRPLAGGAVQTLASGQPCPHRLAVAGGRAFWINMGTEANGFADAGLMTIDLAGGDPTPISSWQGARAGVAADARAVYWMDNYLSEATGPDWTPMLFADFARVPLAGLPASIAVNDTHVYFTTGTLDGDVRRVAR